MRLTYELILTKKIRIDTRKCRPCKPFKPTCFVSIINSDGSYKQTITNEQSPFIIPDSTAIVQTVSGEELAREDIAAGATETIVVPNYALHTYPYHLLNTGQVDSFAIGDDPWVRQNVFEPEMATWPTDRPWVYPTLVDLVTLKDDNYFGNKNRYTNEVGGQDYANGVIIDHATGLMIANFISGQGNWGANIQTHNDRVFFDKSDWHMGNLREWTFIIDTLNRNSIVRSPFLTLNPNSTFTNRYYTSTTDLLSPANAFIVPFSVAIVQDKTGNRNVAFSFRKAFTYDPITEKMILA